VQVAESTFKDRYEHVKAMFQWAVESRPAPVLRVRKILLNVPRTYPPPICVCAPLQHVTLTSHSPLSPDSTGGPFR
jgi:hypothetical protein